MYTKEQENKFETWKHGLLDITKKNKLINYRKTKRATLQLISPSMFELFCRLVNDGECLSFRKQIDVDNDLHLLQLFDIMDRMNAPVELVEGEISSVLSVAEMTCTLKNLRSKAKLSQEEQGINILYLSFGFLKWKNKCGDDCISPLVLVPVSLELESILSPYTIKRLDEDIVINPALGYALHSDFGIELPELDVQNDNLEAFLDRINDMVSKKGWSVIKEANLGLLSFLKIVMYKDLEKNKERILAHPIIRAFCNDFSALPPIDETLNQYRHDSDSAASICQVVNADASQQDAILFSRKGISFVLQGPPGTGKSQTITNIISQALADKKKVLFVSEKMAALSVVYRRLEQVGLADYCLSLHNYKAERRAVIQALVKTLDAPTYSIKAGFKDALSELEDERCQLNSYVEELNRVQQPLNTTLFNVLTEVIALEASITLEASDYYKIEEDVRKLSENELKNRTMSLKKIADFISENGHEIWESPWRGTSITVVNYDIRNIINQELGTLQTYVFDMITSTTGLNQRVGLSIVWTLREFKKIVSAFVRHLLIQKLNNAFTSKYDISTLYQQYNRLERCIQNATESGLPSYSLSSKESITAERTRLRNRREILSNCEELISIVNRAFSVNVQNNPIGLRQCKALIRAVSVPHFVMRNWFNNQLNDLINQCQKWMLLSNNINSIKRRIECIWSFEIYSLNYNELIRRFENEYNVFIKRWWFNKKYREDKSRLVALRRDHKQDLSDDECLSALRELRTYYIALSNYNFETSEASNLLGILYHGIDTNWQNILRILNECAPVNDYIQAYGYFDNLFGYLERPFEERQRTFSSMAEGRSFQQILTEIDTVESKIISSDSLSYQRDGLDTKENCLNELEVAYSDAFNNLKIYDIHIPDGSIAEALGKYKEILRMTDRLTSLTDENKQLFEQIGLTDENFSVLNTFFEEYYDNNALTSQVDSVLSLIIECKQIEFESILSSSHDVLLNSKREKTLSEFKSWFPDVNFDSMSLQELFDYIHRRCNVEELLLWLKFETYCKNFGVSDYLEFVEEYKIPADEIVSVYRKAILSKWLSVAIEQNPYLQNFHSSEHEKIISNFRYNDCKQLGIAKDRLVDQLSHEKPSDISLYSTDADTVFLRKEAEKQRRITPLHKLFKKVPSLILKLKPCFMMSPLSVSYFLDSEMYNFDLVIFDEASQILPEDAIGAIYRGKQVIIVGDCKQMPPTSFFNSASRNTDDYDDDSDEDYSDIVSESILDEATYLPSRMLLCHYRSKDESLISFSNQKLYKNNLITFPNPYSSKDRGVEYVYVPNGYYEAGGNNCNNEEAKKCLELVLEHIQNHPERSIGIIAFSEKQQNKIEEVINAYRLKNRQYDDFFSEDKEEPFFIKNLENVQGDERDTIIFSICYAKTLEGRMYQRFGPLAHDGGERRLNVAITRAKCNVKLVGSILPTDIIVKEETKEGVRMLQAYIQYAMQNKFSIATGADNASDEPFADYISSVLEKEGYHCTKNVGTSQYKVDIAVRLSEKDNEYIAGIECDGNTYSSARTARDRDVLRRSIMRSLGWKMYHVWSMAWFLKPEIEKERLLGFLSKCAMNQDDGEKLQDACIQLDSYCIEELPPTDVQQLTDVENLGDCHDSNTLSFDAYIVANPQEAPDSNLITQIKWIVEQEHPIHVEELYRRLAYVLGQKKVTASVRNTIDNCLRQLLESTNMIRKGDFIYLKDSPIKARNHGDNPRSIDHISPEEIQNGMIRIVSFARGISIKELITETARNFGYARTGTKISESLKDNCNELISTGEFKEIDEKLYCSMEVNK